MSEKKNLFNVISCASNAYIFQHFGNEQSIGNELASVFIRLDPVDECCCIFNVYNNIKLDNCWANDKGK